LASSREALVAPGKAFVPFQYHWKLKGGSPLAWTENKAGWPCVTTRLAGGTRISGGDLTCSKASLLLAKPYGFVTWTS
jgi:hypothetical protein